MVDNIPIRVYYNPCQLFSLMLIKEVKNMYILIMIAVIALLAGLYIRYIPVRGVRCTTLCNNDDRSIQIVDVRDYNLSYKDPIPTAITMPVAYLKRNYHEIPKMKIHIVAADQLEKNISIRFLRKRGYDVIGYAVTECNCNKHLKAKSA